MPGKLSTEGYFVFLRFELLHVLKSVFADCKRPLLNEKSNYEINPCVLSILVHTLD